MTQVLLLNMPFVSVSRPAIGISLLKARLAEEGIECRVGYPNLSLAARIGLESYELIDDKLSHALFAGDWLFADHLFGAQLDQQTYLHTLRGHMTEEQFATYQQLRGMVGEFLDGCLAEFDIRRYDIIGFTTTFEQNLASLALARLIKTAYPRKTIVFGGGNCEGVMGLELHRSFPWIDFVCSGESDYTFPALVKRLATGASLEGIGGLIFRQGGESRLAAPPDRVHEMDALPDPDYTEYFSTLERHPLKAELRPVLLLESARGCWWGAKSHCTFCGLNGETLAFRSKSADRVLAELDRQHTRYGLKHFVAVDNIMSHDFFKTLLPTLKERQLGFSFFYEIKSNLKREQIELLRDAGVLAIQPGVESLSSHVLQLMKKGVTAIQNIQLLKWCREYGIESAWNLLYGFPGETPEDYQQTARSIEAIYHLRPPGAVSAIRLDRFSPNFNFAEQFGLTSVRPFALYNYLYPLPPERVANLAYFFEYAYADGHAPSTYMQGVLDRAQVWKGDSRGDLIKVYGKDPELLIMDTRAGRPPSSFPLQGLQREIYDFCDEARSWPSILKFAQERLAPTEQLVDSLKSFLDSLVDWQLMFCEGNQYLSLAIAGARRPEPNGVPNTL